MIVYLNLTSNIVLAVLATGELFLDDSRAGQTSRVELCEIVYESDEDEAQRIARPQFVYSLNWLLSPSL